MPYGPELALFMNRDRAEFFVFYHACDDILDSDAVRTRGDHLFSSSNGGEGLFFVWDWVKV